MGYDWTRPLTRGRPIPSDHGYLYKLVIQSELLYGAKSCVLTERMMVSLRSFHHRCARFIAGDHIRQMPDGSWICPENAAVLEIAGLWTIDESSGDAGVL
jgi:hypothetical protein